MKDTDELDPLAGAPVGRVPRSSGGGPNSDMKDELP